MRLYVAAWGEEIARAETFMALARERGHVITHEQALSAGVYDIILTTPQAKALGAFRLRRS